MITRLSEEEVLFKDGSLHTVLAAQFAIRDTSGRSIGTGTIATDVTDRRSAEERLRHSQQMEALGQLTGGMAHDFNNLLAVIIGNLDLLREKFSDLHADEAIRSLIDDSLSWRSRKRLGATTSCIRAPSEARARDDRSQQTCFGTVTRDSARAE